VVAVAGASALFRGSGGAVKEAGNAAQHLAQT